MQKKGLPPADVVYYLAVKQALLELARLGLVNATAAGQRQKLS
jgi:hypothetical protein